MTFDTETCNYEDENLVKAFESLSNLKQVEATQQRLPSMWKNLHRQNHRHSR